MKKLSLTTWIFIGFGIGILLGLIFGEDIVVIKPLGDLFMRLIKMLIVPLVFFTIVNGITKMGDVRKLKRIGGKTLLYYFISTFVASTIGLLVANLYNPGAGMVLDALALGNVKAVTSPPLTQTILNMFPTNPVASMANFKLVQIIVFAAFVGVAIVLAGDKAKGIRKFFEEGTEIIYKITSMVMATSPIGVLALIAFSVGKFGPAIFGPMAQLIIADYLGISIILFVVYALVVKLYVGMDLVYFYKNAFKVWVVAASTTSSSATLPHTMNITTNELKAPKEIAGFTLPLGATINMDGSANFFAIAAIFAANVYGIEIPLSQQITIILMAIMLSIGAAGIPGGGIVLTVMLLTTMGLPAEIMAVIAGLWKILDIAQTTNNVAGDMVATLVISKSENLWPAPSDT